MKPIKSARQLQIIKNKRNKARRDKRKALKTPTNELENKANIKALIKKGEKELKKIKNPHPDSIALVTSNKDGSNAKLEILAINEIPSISIPQVSTGVISSDSITINFDKNIAIFNPEESKKEEFKSIEFIEPARKRGILRYFKAMFTGLSPTIRAKWLIFKYLYLGR